MFEIMKLNSIHVRKFDFDPHFHGKINYDNKHRMIKIFNLKGISILNIEIIERKPPYESGKDIYIYLLIDLLISNNFSSMTFFCATRILRVIGRQSIRQSTDFLLIFWHNKKKTSKIKFIKYI